MNNRIDPGPAVRKRSWQRKRLAVNDPNNFKQALMLNDISSDARIYPLSAKVADRLSAVKTGENGYRSARLTDVAKNVEQAVSEHYEKHRVRDTTDMKEK